MRELFLIFFFLEVTMYSFAEQAHIIEQHDAPLKILEAKYKKTIDQQTHLITLKNFHFKCQNISNKGIRAWGIVWTITDASGHKQEITTHTDLSLPTKSTEPNHTFTWVDLRAQYTSQAVREVTIKVEFVDGDDGLLWDPNNSINYKIILVRRDEVKAERNRLIDLFNASGMTAVWSDLEQKIRSTEETKRNQRTRTGVNAYVYAYRVMVWEAIQKHGMEGLRNILAGGGP